MDRSQYYIDKFESTEVEDIIATSKEKKILTRKELQSCVNMFLSTLKNPDDIYNNKPMLFNGLLEFIYRHKIKYIIPDTIEYDWKLLDELFDNVYIYLCYIFGYVPFLTTFTSHLVKIDVKYIYNIKTGIRQTDDRKVNPNTVRYIQKWLNICDTDLFNHVLQNNSVGGMFVAKVRGYSDQPQNISVSISAETPKIDLKQISTIAKTGITPPIDN